MPGLLHEVPVRAAKGRVLALGCRPYRHFGPTCRDQRHFALRRFPDVTIEVPSRETAGGGFWFVFAP